MLLTRLLNVAMCSHDVRISGIPPTLMLLTALVERLMVPTAVLFQTLHSRLGQLYQRFNIRRLYLAIVVTGFVAFLMLLPALVFAALEPEGEFLNSLYHCFMSLTTVGFGGYVPGYSQNKAYRPLYKVATIGDHLVVFSDSGCILRLSPVEFWSVLDAF